MRNAHNPLIGKPEEKRWLGRHRYGCEDNIKVDLTEIGYGLDSTGSEYGSVTGFYDHSNEASGSIEAVWSPEYTLRMARKEEVDLRKAMNSLTAICSRNVFHIEAKEFDECCLICFSLI